MGIQVGLQKISPVRILDEFRRRLNFASCDCLFVVSVVVGIALVVLL